MIETKANMTCPHCGDTYEVEMPTNMCIIALECRSCGETIRPKDGDCCVFCSYADRRCPPMQESLGI
jgi:hypothetical protein